MFRHVRQVFFNWGKIEIQTYVRFGSKLGAGKIGNVVIPHPYPFVITKQSIFDRNNKKKKLK